MTGLPKPSAYAVPNLLTMLVYRDSNILDPGRGAAFDLLLRMQDEGWIQFTVADTALIESSRATDPDTAERLLSEIAKGFVSRGPAIHGHSDEDFAVHASPEDHQRIEQVHDLIWNRPWHDDIAKAGRDARNRVRDTLHVATAIRYGAQAFITDDEAIQTAAGPVAERLGLVIWSPEQAVAALGREVELMRKRWARGEWNPALPSWPGPDDLAL